MIAGKIKISYKAFSLAHSKYSGTVTAEIYSLINTDILGKFNAHGNIEFFFFQIKRTIVVLG